MSVPFEIPDWLLDKASAPSSAPPDTSDVDPHRVEDLVNRFIAGKQEALFTAPDAYYRTEGREAVDGEPAILDRLGTLQNATLAAAGDDGTRFVLAPRLGAHLDDARDGIDRHVTAERDVLTRQIIGERQRLIQNAALLEHNNDNKLAGLAEAHATAAAELARLNGEPETPAMDAARSAIWRAVIDQHLANGNAPQALALFDQVKDQLAPPDQLALETPVQVARANQAARQWITRETTTDGPPIKDRLDADPSLPLDTKNIVRAQLNARDSADESKRAATTQELDDQVTTAGNTLATRPGAYKPGTFARIADAYDAAGAQDKAKFIRGIAAQEAFLLPFAQASAEKQQQMIDQLPEGDLRANAMAIQRSQAIAFTNDPFAAGTALYREVGPPVPIDDIQGRIRQARQIAQLRGGISVRAFTVDEMDSMQRTLATGSEAEKQAVRARLAAVPESMRPVIESPDQSAAQDSSTGKFGLKAAPGMLPPAQPDTADGPDAPPSGGGQGFTGPEPAPGSDVYRNAESQRAFAQERQRFITDRMISQWLSTAQPGSPMPTELATRLDPEETREVEELALGWTPITSDRDALAQVMEGLKSQNWVTRRQWAQTPLYRYKSRLSRDDYAKAVALQQELDREGMTRAELVALKRPGPDTSDLDGAYKALNGDPGIHHFQYLPLGFDRSGNLYLVSPEAARSFLRGGLDLLKGTKTGELTPEAIGTFAGLAAGAGQVLGPLADGATFGAGGARWLKMGGTPDKFSPTGRAVVERMRAEGLIHGEGPLLRGNPNQLRLVTKDGPVLINSTIDMAHKIDAVTWWNRIGYTYGTRAADVRRFMLDPNNYVLQPSRINRSSGARLRETYREPVSPAPETPKR